MENFAFFNSHCSEHIQYTRLKFRGMVFNRAVPFLCSELIFLYSSSIRNCIAYANEENIVSKNSPIHVEISLLLPRLLLEFMPTQTFNQLSVDLNLVHRLFMCCLCLISLAWCSLGRFITNFMFGIFTRSHSCCGRPICGCLSSK